jgi:hypothetical protein
MNETQMLNFNKKIEFDLVTGCWNWTSYTCKGYGRIYLNKKSRRAHRVSYEYWKGKIPKHLVLDHLCRNRRCVNPSHLEAVTLYENMIRSPIHNINKKKCSHGHPYSESNTYRTPDRHRECKICRKLQRKKLQFLQLESGV